MKQLKTIVIRDAEGKMSEVTVRAASHAHAVQKAKALHAATNNVPESTLLAVDGWKTDNRAWMKKVRVAHVGLSNTLQWFFDHGFLTEAECRGVVGDPQPLVAINREASVVYVQKISKGEK